MQHSCSLEYGVPVPGAHGASAGLRSEHPSSSSTPRAPLALPWPRVCCASGWPLSSAWLSQDSVPPAPPGRGLGAHGARRLRASGPAHSLAAKAGESTVTQPQPCWGPAHPRRGPSLRGRGSGLRSAPLEGGVSPLLQGAPAHHPAHPWRGARLPPSALPSPLSQGHACHRVWGGGGPAWEGIWTQAPGAHGGSDPRPPLRGAACPLE